VRRMSKGLCESCCRKGEQASYQDECDNHCDPQSGTPQDEATWLVLTAYGMSMRTQNFTRMSYQGENGIESVIISGISIDLIELDTVYNRSKVLKSRNQSRSLLYTPAKVDKFRLTKLFVGWLVDCFPGAGGWSLHFLSVKVDGITQ